MKRKSRNLDSDEDLSKSQRVSCLVWIIHGLNCMAILALCAAAIVRFTNFSSTTTSTATSTTSETTTKSTSETTSTSSSAPTDPFYYMLTFYLIPFAALLTVAELQYTRVLKYFQFLGHLHGRGLFMIFVALLLFDTKYAVDTAVSIGVMTIGLINIGMICFVPRSAIEVDLLAAARGREGSGASKRSGSE